MASPSSLEKFAAQLWNQAGQVAARWLPTGSILDIADPFDSLSMLLGGHASSGVREARAASVPEKLSWTDVWLARIITEQPLSEWIQASNSSERPNRRECVRNMVEESVAVAIQEVQGFDYSTAKGLLSLEKGRYSGIHIEFQKRRFTLKTVDQIEAPWHVRAECVRLFTQVLLHPLMRHTSLLMVKFKDPLVNSTLKPRIFCTAKVEVDTRGIWTISARLLLSIKDQKKEGGTCKATNFSVGLEIESKSKGPIHSDNDATGWNLKLKGSKEEALKISFIITSVRSSPESSFERCLHKPLVIRC